MHESELSIDRRARQRGQKKALQISFSFENFLHIMPKATQGPARAPKNPSKAKKASLVAQRGKATLDNIRSLQDQEKTTHGRAANTSKKYAGYVKTGRQWLDGHFNGFSEANPSQPGANLDTGNPPTEPENGPGGAHSTNDTVYDHPEFKNSFSAIPNQFSDKALALFISYKCFHENLGQSTAEGAHAAFKMLWKNSYVVSSNPTARIGLIGISI